jgi:hypothetical protein
VDSELEIAGIFTVLSVVAKHRTGRNETLPDDLVPEAPTAIDGEIDIAAKPANTAITLTNRSSAIPTR